MSNNMIENLKNAIKSIQDFLEIKVFHLGGQDVTILRVLIFIILLLFIGKIIKQINKGISRLLQKRGKDENSAFNITRLITIVLWLVGGLVLLDIVGVKVTGIMAILAALGIGIGFGLQNLINNIVGGIILLIERPIRIGDIIEVDKVLGKVRSIGLRATLIMTLDNIEILVPNSKFLDNDLINLSYSDRIMRLNLEFGVHYKSDPREVEKVALSVVSENDVFLNEPAPQVHFVAFGDSSLNFILRVWINTPWDKFKIKSNLYYALFEKLKEANIEIPYPQRDLHIRSSDVSLNN